MGANQCSCFSRDTARSNVFSLTYINDLRPTCPAVKYVDGSTVWKVRSTSGSGGQLQTCADQTVEWSRQRKKMLLNCDKTKEMLVHVHG